MFQFSIDVSQYYSKPKRMRGVSCKLFYGLQVSERNTPNTMEKPSGMSWRTTGLGKIEKEKQKTSKCDIDPIVHTAECGRYQGLSRKRCCPWQVETRHSMVSPHVAFVVAFACPLKGNERATCHTRSKRQWRLDVQLANSKDAWGRHLLRRAFNY